jgi:alpha-tubulin suppressor-like RCC1 family protein
VKRLGVVALVLALVQTLGWLAGCSDSPGGPACCDPLPEGLIVSDPVATSGVAAATGAALALSPSAEDSVVYVSLPPGTVPAGRLAVLRRVGDAATLSTPVLDGGFDPVPVEAHAGDSIEVLVRDAGGATVEVLGLVIAARRPPIIVRTDPPRRKTDVPLNSVMVLVFSEPVDAGTFTSSSVQLFRGTTSVPGTASLLQGTATAAVFQPAAQLDPNTDYRLVVTTAIRDLTGDALGADVSVEFMTGTTATLPALFVTVTPDTAAIQIGWQVQLSAAARDTNGAPVIGRPVTWSSDNPTVVAVSITGLVTALAEGRGEIRAKVDGARGTGVVFVTATLPPVDSVAVSPGSATIAVAGRVQLTATLIDSAGSVLPFRPITWATSAPGVATVAAASGGQARVTGVSPGTATITATSEGKSTRVPITVEDPGPYAVLSGASGFWFDGHTCAVTANAWAFCWGGNRFGQLGDGTREGSAVPIGVEGGRKFSQVSTSQHATCALTPQGAAYCWGDNNSFGLLGIGRATGGTATPLPVSGELGFSTVDAGAFSHACALTHSGAAYCWGRNDQGELGIGTTSGPEDCAGDGLHPCSTTPVAVAGGRTFTALQVGSAHACALTASGSAYCWGVNSDGQLGDGTTITRTSPVQVAGGLAFVAIRTTFDHTCALTATGVAYCWGSNASGQLGVGTVTGPEVCAQDNTPDACSTVPVPIGALTWATISPGYQHTCAVTAGGVAYCWGRNEDGELGTGSTQRATTPMAVSGGLTFASLSAGGTHTCGTTTAGIAYCWGSNRGGELGNGSFTSSTVPTKVAGQP